MIDVVVGVVAVMGSVLCAAVAVHHFRGPREKELRYGHPEPPVSALRRAIPRAPTGYQWETKVTCDPSTGHYWMHLALVDIATGENYASMKTNLTWGEYWSWAEGYRKYGGFGLDGSTFRNDLIGPVVDWATVTVNKFGPEVTEYKLGS